MSTRHLRRPLSLTATMAALAVCLWSCSAPKTTMTYFDNLPADTDYIAAAALAADTQVRIAPDDDLQIGITSTVPGAALMFSNSATFQNAIDTRTGQVITQPTSTESTYLVGPDGYITFPVLGRLHVAGMTVTQLADDLTARIAREIEDPVVTVRLVNFKVNVLGEVNKPGVVRLEGEQRMTVLEALAGAEDLTAYAVRDDVLVIREEADGSRKVHHLNLNDAKTLESPYFMLRQNDVVIVRPNEVAQSNARYDTNKSYKVQVTSAIISAASVVASLVIALAIK